MRPDEMVLEPWSFETERAASSRWPHAERSREQPADGAAARARRATVPSAARAHDRARPSAHASAPRARARGGSQAGLGRRARAPEPARREHRLRRQAGRQVGLAVDPPGRGARADRAVRLRQDDAAADAQPPHRADRERLALGRDPARRRGHPRPRRHDAALARGDGLPAAQPVSDVDLRQRRVRAARAGAQAPRAPRARAARGRRAAPRRASTRRSATTSTGRRCACPAASSSGCASRARSRRGPRCC